MQKFRDIVSALVTPQRQPIPGREAEMVQNEEGGYVWGISAPEVLDRFLILGTEGGTYYARETRLNAKLVPVVRRLIQQAGPYVVRRAVEISLEGRAAKNDPALFVHALASVEGDADTKREAYESLNRIARTGTHLLHWVQYRDLLGGWGRGARTAVARWYAAKSPDQLGYQLLKYKQRDGWSHRDALRLCHLNGDRDLSDAQHAVVRQIVFGQDVPEEWVHAQYVASLELRKEGRSLAEKCALVRQHKLTREMLPTQMLNKPETWEALFPDLPYMAMVRNLRNMAKCELLTPMSDIGQAIAERIDDDERIAGSRVHPIQLLSALLVYGGNAFVRRSHWDTELAWQVDPRVLGALESAFYKSFGNVEPTGKRTFIGLDVSTSMLGGWGSISDRLFKLGFDAATAATAMCMVTMRTEPNCHLFGFSHRFRPLNISARDTLESAMRTAYNGAFGGTDCSLPMIYARKKRIPVDVFVIYTDNETHSGYSTGHPSQALQRYRQAMGIGAKLIVVAMTSTGYSIADPQDPGMLDVVGFDTNTPRAISEFARS